MKRMSVGEKRLLAAIIDYTIIIFLAPYISLIISFGNKDSIAYQIIGLLYLFTSIIFKDNLYKSGSFGKKILGIGIYDINTNNYVSNNIKIRRNIEMIFNINETPLILFKIEKNPRRYCDIKYNTKIDNIHKS